MIEHLHARIATLEEQRRELTDQLQAEIEFRQQFAAVLLKLTADAELGVVGGYSPKVPR